MNVSGSAARSKTSRDDDDSMDLKNVISDDFDCCHEGSTIVGPRSPYSEGTTPANVNRSVTRN